MKQYSKNAFSEHLFEYRAVEKKKLILSLIITSIVMFIEIIGGLFTHSIALLSDAGHMFTHCFAISISLIAIFVAKRPLCHHKTFGLYRAEILAAFVNGLFLLIVSGFIIYEAIIRFLYPETILGYQMLLIAVIGLTVNIISIFILHGSHKEDLNIKGVFYHMIADAASSICIVIAAFIILYTGWNIVDPIVSLGISAMIIYWAWSILKESTIILLEMAPTGLNVEIISESLKEDFPEIKKLFNVHLWTITANMLVFTAHIALHGNNEYTFSQDTLIEKINKYLSDKYSIIESTIQVSDKSEAEVCNVM